MSTRSSAVFIIGYKSDLRSVDDKFCILKILNNSNISNYITNILHALHAISHTQQSRQKELFFSFLAAN